VRYYKTLSFFFPHKSIIANSDHLWYFIYVYKGGCTMHFVISVFVSIAFLSIIILFAEILPKWIKALFAIGGSATTGMAVFYGLRRLAKVTKWFKTPALLPTFITASVCVLIIIIICTILLKRRRDKLSQETEKDA
jgi:hypothetical protein